MSPFRFTVTLKFNLYGALTSTPWAARRSVVFLLVSWRKTAAGNITQMHDPRNEMFRTNKMINFSFKSLQGAPFLLFK